MKEKILYAIGAIIIGALVLTTVSPEIFSEPITGEDIKKAIDFVIQIGSQK